MSLISPDEPEAGGEDAEWVFARVAKLRRVDPAGLSDQQLLDYVEVVEAAGRQVEAMRLAAARELRRAFASG